MQAGSRYLAKDGQHDWAKTGCSFGDDPLSQCLRTGLKDLDLDKVSPLSETQEGSIFWQSILIEQTVWTPIAQSIRHKLEPARY